MSISGKNGTTRTYPVINGRLPQGWGKVTGATTAPKGYTWVNNRKSRFGKNSEYRNALIKTSSLSLSNG